jgi:hypothetical protein
VHDTALAKLATVEADIIGAEAIGKLIEEEKVFAVGGYFEVELAGFLIPEDGEEAVHALEAGGLLGEGLGGIFSMGR